MAITTEEFNNFAEFGRERLNQAQADLTLEDLVMEWDSSQHRDEINAAISEGLADADAGRHRAAADAMSELRKKYGIGE